MNINFKTNVNWAQKGSVAAMLETGLLSLKELKYIKNSSDPKSLSGLANLGGQFLLVKLATLAGGTSAADARRGIRADIAAAYMPVADYVKYMLGLLPPDAREARRALNALRRGDVAGYRQAARKYHWRILPYDGEVDQKLIDRIEDMPAKRRAKQKTKRLTQKKNITEEIARRMKRWGVVGYYFYAAARKLGHNAQSVRGLSKRKMTAPPYTKQGEGVSATFLAGAKAEFAIVVLVRHRYLNRSRMKDLFKQLGYWEKFYARWVESRIITYAAYNKLRME